MHLLDSDTATLVYYGRNEEVKGRYDNFPEDEPLALSPITRAEILRGRLDSLIKAATPAEWMVAQARLREAEEWLAGFDVAEITPVAGEHFDRLLKNKKLKEVGRADLLSACVALAHGATLVTRNLKDFQPIPGLKVENWAD
jgi:tRNA(fMet)-specific endonuclease VapC